ncbi:MAG: nuclear transport factor 2 family protein [Chloroflexi bacterium]|jgi:ketosteroid isomerase-like protein|nr:nuclear transport factor 2 family protein [Chloroflexota bacterium]
MEDLLGPDFTFTSPYDDHIDRTSYFDRCWPNNDMFRAVHVEKVFDDGDEAFVRYRAELKTGVNFRNTEFFRFEGGRIREIEVYFGSLP